MPRVSEIEIDQVPVEAQPIYRRFANEYGPFLNQVKIFSHRPPALRHIMGLLLELADEEVLPKRYLEIGLVVVSKLNDCEGISCNVPHGAFYVFPSCQDIIGLKTPNGKFINNSIDFSSYFTLAFNDFLSF